MRRDSLRWTLRAGVASLGALVVGAGIVGCPPACTVAGTPGDDWLYGEDGQDDVICGYGGNDHLFGRGGNDILRGGPGDDVLDGGGGNDWADFSDSPGPVSVDLYIGSAYGNGSDDLISIRRVQGSAYDDDLTGGYGDDVLNGGSGNDELNGGYGSDTLRGENGNDIVYGSNGPDQLFGDAGDDYFEANPGEDEFHGGEGSDTLSYASTFEGPVVVSGGTAIVGDGNDTLASIEILEGSWYDDYLAPNSPGVIRGLLGDDTLVGDPSKTTVDYSMSDFTGVTVDLALGTASGGEDDDTLSGIRNITGSRFADVLRGDEHKNVILGGDGNDQLFGKTNDDTLDGQVGNDSADGGLDVDTCSAESEVNCELN